MENTEGYQISEDLRQSTEYGKYMQTLGWKCVKLDRSIQIFIRKLGPVGIAKLQRAEMPLPMNEIEKLLSKERVMMCIVEPLGGKTEELEKFGFKINKEPLLGTRTLRVDLKPRTEEIFNSFKKDARYILRKSEMTDIKWDISNYKEFYEIWKKSGKRKKLWIPKEKDYISLIECFGKDVFCISVAEMAGALILIHNKTAFYYYAGGTYEGIKMNLPYLAVWTAMKEAKKRGCLLWDFEGIFDARWPNKGWRGFTHFKKSFGGQEIVFPGSFTKWRWPF